MEGNKYISCVKGASMEGNKCIYLVSHLCSSLNSYVLALIFNSSNQFPNYSFNFQLLFELNLVKNASMSCYHKHATQIQCYKY